MIMCIYMDASLSCKCDFSVGSRGTRLQIYIRPLFAGVSGLLAPMEFAGLLLIRLADC